MGNEKDIFRTIISILGNLGILEHLLLIGSWAEYLYEITYFEDFRSNLRTRDVDMLIMNLGRPREKVDIKRSLEEHGFVYAADTLTGVTKFFHGTLELEFLAREIGAGQTKAYVSKSLGVKVEGLRNMDMLIESQIKLEIYGYLVNVPTPPAYVLHKLLIWPKRGAKQEKDMRAIENLLDTFERFPSEKDNLRELYHKLSRKQVGTIDNVCKANAIKLFAAQY